jgi:hypothetical protein
MRVFLVNLDGATPSWLMDMAKDAIRHESPVIPIVPAMLADLFRFGAKPCDMVLYLSGTLQGAMRVLHDRSGTAERQRESASLGTFGLVSSALSADAEPLPMGMVLYNEQPERQLTSYTTEVGAVMRLIQEKLRNGIVEGIASGVSYEQGARRDQGGAAQAGGGVGSKGKGGDAGRHRQ